jgi:hypothetical protein
MEVEDDEDSQDSMDDVWVIYLWIYFLSGNEIWRIYLRMIIVLIVVATRRNLW